MVKVLELFGGIGAPRKALENLEVNYEVVDYVEIDPHAVKSYNALYGEVYEPQDISTWDKDLDVDIVFHGSPCVNFSMAGDQSGGEQGSGTQSSLMWHTVRIVEKLRPKVVIWENVKSVLNKNHIDTFTKYIDKLRELGYYSTYKVLDARDFGIPQARDRLFVISILGNEFDFNNLIIKDMKHISEFITYNDNERYLVTQPSMVSQLPLEVNRENERYNMVKEIKDFTWTISTKQVRSPNAGVINLSNGDYRYLTERECWRLMGFTDVDYEKAKSVNPRRADFMNTQLYKQAGNSIVVQVLESILLELLDTIELL